MTFPMRTDGDEQGLRYARRFFDLVVYKRARQLMREVFEVTRTLPKEEMYSLTDQWRRSARSIGAKIAEAWAKRSYPKHFASKLSDADAEQFETQHWTISALDCGYITQTQAKHLGSLAVEIGRMLGEMITKAEAFDGKNTLVNEDQIPYTTDSSQAFETEY